MGVGMSQCSRLPIKCFDKKTWHEEASMVLVVCATKLTRCPIWEKPFSTRRILFARTVKKYMLWVPEPEYQGIFTSINTDVQALRWGAQAVWLCNGFVLPFFFATHWTSKSMRPQDSMDCRDAWALESMKAPEKQREDLISNIIIICC